MYPTPRSHRAPIMGRHGAVGANHPMATQAGLDILRAGGNAVDASVAISLALGVCEPMSSGLGGDGFYHVYMAGTGKAEVFNGTGSAPMAATPERFRDGIPVVGPLSVSVPASLAGIAAMHAAHGRLPWAKLVAPAIALARDGFIVADDLAESLPREASRLKRWPSTVKVFFKSDGTTLSAGDRLTQPDLAATLQGIAQNGPRDFYEGATAQKIAEGIRSAGGVMTAEDLKNYRAIERAPVRGTYRGYDIVSMAPPSSGGIALIEMLNILEGYDLAHDSQPQELFLLVEAMKRAYADRAYFLGDPDAVKVPVARLISKSYAAEWRKSIDPEHATAAEDIKPFAAPIDGEGRNTTHYSVIDRFGNAVSNTYTLNFSYGMGMVADGTGVLLNNELDDFAAKPAVPNAYGLIGFEANAPGPGKRPLSSQTPTIVLKDGKPFLVTGSPGGSLIINAVLQVAVNVIDRGLDIAAAVAAPRLYDQWTPDVVLAEPGFPDDAIKTLEARGDAVLVGKLPTSTNSILATPSGFVGAADPRTPGALAVGY